jgi:hypothetical protein
MTFIVKTKFRLILLLFISLASCKKEPEQSCGTCPGGGTVNSLVGFSYVKNNGASVNADSAFYNSVSKTITSYYNGISTRVNIKTTSQAPGTYSFTTPGNALSYTETSFTYIASGGSIVITSNVNNKLSGNFVSNGTGGGIISLTGQFKDIKLK